MVKTVKMKKSLKGKQFGQLRTCCCCRNMGRDRLDIKMVVVEN